MSVDLTAEQVIQWFKAAEDDDEFYDALYELPYESVGSVFELPGVTDFQLQVEATNTARSYDSYGYGFLEDGYVVFSATHLDGSSFNFKLPLTYASFEGWNYNINDITRVEKREKVITAWEWANV